MRRTEKHIPTRFLALLLTLCMLMQVCPPQLVMAAEASHQPAKITAGNSAEKDQSEETPPVTDSQEKDSEKAVIPANAEEIAALAALTAEARAKNKEEYVNGWEAMQAALAEADTVLKKEQPTQDEVSGVFTMLRSSMDTLVPVDADLFSAERLALAADQGIQEAGDSASLPAEIPDGATVVLTADIVLDQNQQINLIAGTLDGRGHTITLNGRPLAAEVTGTVQNLIVNSASNITGAMFGPTFGSIAVSMNGGSILNCASLANVTDNFNDAGGLAGRSVGGVIRNSFYAGKITGTSYGGLIGVSQDSAQPSTITEGYYTDGGNGGLPVIAGTAYNKAEGRFAKKTLDEMKAPGFVELLNANIPATGYVWAASNGGLPVLTAAGGSDPEPETPAPEAADFTKLNEVIAEAEASFAREMASSREKPATS